MRVVVCLSLIVACISIVCQSPSSRPGIKRIRGSDTTIETVLSNLFLNKSSFTLGQRKQKLDSLRPHIQNANYKSYNLYLYLTGVVLENSNHSDSALEIFGQMLNGSTIDSEKDADLIILKNIGQISAKSNSWVDEKLITDLYNIIRFAEKVKYRYIYEVYNVAAGTYFKYGDTTMPAYYLKLGFESYPGLKTPRFKAYYYNRVGTCLIAAKKWQEANRYLDSGYQIALLSKDTVLLASTFEKKSSIYAQMNDHKKKIYFQNQAFNIRRKAGLLGEVDWNNQGVNLQKQGKYNGAIKYYHRALQLAKERDNLYIIQSAYGGLHYNYLQLKNYEMSARYRDSSYATEVAILEKREADKVADITMKYEREKKDEQILQLNKQAFFQTRILNQQRIIIFSLAACILAVIVTGFVLFRQRKLRVENERLEAAWNKLSLEQRLLRSQMEPHFISNSLSVLQSFIRSNKKEKATKYLSKFARLLRLNLENSRAGFVHLSEEVEALENYLVLQQMRNEGLFTYNIDAYDEYEDDDVLIPPMLIQPFVENAVLHGMRNLLHQGKISISIRKQSSTIICTIEDNGLGIKEHAPENKSSLSTIITQERLQGLSKQTNQPASLEIIDKTPEQGVIVNLVIPFQTKWS